MVVNAFGASTSASVSAWKTSGMTSIQNTRDG